jgi:two-component system sensor histidine kinase ChiS
MSNVVRMKTPSLTSSAFTRLTIVMISLGVLFALRLGWSELFHTADAPPIEDGVLDMRGVDLNNSTIYYLNGVWEFYPGELLAFGETETAKARFINVPADWGDELNGINGSSYGFGTYRLRILVDPLVKPVSLWIKKIQTASRVEVNGESEGDIGKPASRDAGYLPRAVSYASTYYDKGATKLDIIIHAANYDKPTKGGIVSSIRFGSQGSIDSMRWYSIGFQLVTFIILLLHGLYTCILYQFNRKETDLLLTGLLTLSVGVALLVGHDNILQLWLPINYTWALKIGLIAVLWQNHLILQLFSKFASPPVFSMSLKVHAFAVTTLTGLLLSASTRWINAFIDLKLFIVFFLVSIAWLIYIIAGLIFKQQTDKDIAFMLLSAAGIISNLGWNVAGSTDILTTTVYYPIDILVAIVGFSSYWFKKYYRNARQNSKLTLQLRRADKLKDQFLANTSHELKTPLHGIMNIAETVVRNEKGNMNEKSVKDMELLLTISRRMSTMLFDLLDVALLRDQRITLHQERLSVQAIVTGVIPMLNHMTVGKQIILQMDIADSAPPVWADEKRVVQVIYNLLHNALKFTESGTIAVKAYSENDRLVVTVIDTGIGMDEETQARIFFPYEQGAHGVSDGNGVGLGLSICKQLVELHGGELTVNSEPGKGSVFRFSLPLAGAEPNGESSVQKVASFRADFKSDSEVMLDGGQYAAAAEAEVNDETEASPPVSPLLNKGLIHILAVDDDPVNLSVLQGILSTESYHVTTALSAHEALGLIGTKRWDLLIADVMMPQMSGYEMTLRIREQYSHFELPVLLLTARSQPSDIYTGFSSGANDYVTKPVDAVELRYRIRALTSLNQSIREQVRMEAAYLQAQIQPHFLFNTLNSIMALASIDTEKMMNLGEAFASFLRISFNFLNTEELVDLSYELELTQAYLYIEKVRFEDRLTIVWEIETGLKLLLPPLSIQPLVENAVKHGLLNRPKDGKIRIRVAGYDGFALIEVEDNGVGIEPDQIERLIHPTLKENSGIGISNTNRRLIQQFGKGLSISSKQGEGTVISFTVPDIRAD